MPGINRIIRDKRGYYAKVDQVVGALRAIDIGHSEIHSGESFTVNQVATKNAGQSHEVRIQTPNSMTEVHFLLRVSSSGASTVYLYETTSKTHAAGNAITPTNRNRNHKGTSTCKVCHTPGGAGDGTQIYSEAMGVGKNQGGESRATSEFILKRNTAYLIKYTSAAASCNLNMELDWYEERTVTYTTTTTTTTTSTTSTTSSTTTAP